MKGNYRLVLFDVDSTLIEQEVIDLLANETNHGAQVSEITSRAMAGEINFDEALRERVALLRGLSEEVFAKVAQQISFSPGAIHLLSELKKRSIRVGAVSGGFLNILNPLFKDFELDFLLANTLEVNHGILSGKVIGPIVNRAAKREALFDFAEKFSVDIRQTVAVGDGANDLEMIESAGLGVSYRGKPILNDAADLLLTEPRLDLLLNYL